MMDKVVIVGSNSVHTIRYIEALLEKKQFIIYVITNSRITDLSDINQFIINFSLFNLRAKQDIFKVLNLIQPAIIHIHQANSYAFHTIRAANKLDYNPKIILTTWGSDILILPKKNYILKKMVKYNLIKSDEITSDSLYMASKIAKLLLPHTRPIHIINFGIKDFPLKVDINIKQNIIISNRLHKPLYQIDKIIKAFAKLYLDNKIANDYQLVIAGSGIDTPKLKMLAGNLGVNDKVIFVGMLDYNKLKDYYKYAKLFISVPKSDATSLSLLESMAYSCIPILSNLPANLEWVLDDINGIICQELDSLDIAILRALELIESKEKYSQITYLNYSIMQHKAKLNINKFIKLYY